MGGRSVEAFFISCDDHYLAKNLSSIRDEVMAEGEALTNYQGPYHPASKVG